MRNRKLKKFLYSAMVLTSVAGTGLTSIISVAEGNSQKVVAATDPIADSTTPRVLHIQKHKNIVGNNIQDDGKQNTTEEAKDDVLPNVYFRATYVTETGKDDYTKYDLTDPTLDQGKFTRTDNVYYGKTDDKGNITMDLSKWMGGGKKADGYWLIEELGFWNGASAPTITDGVSSNQAGMTDPNNFTMQQVDGATTTTYEKAQPYFAILPQTDRDDHGSLLYDVYTYPKNTPTTNTIAKNIEDSAGFSPQKGDSFWWGLSQDVPAKNAWTLGTDKTYSYQKWVSGDGNYNLTTEKVTGQTPTNGLAFGQFGWNDILPAGLQLDQNQGVKGVTVSVYDDKGTEHKVELTGDDLTVTTKDIPSQFNGLNGNNVVGEGSTSQQVIIDLTDTGKQKLYDVLYSTSYTAKSINTHVWTKVVGDLGGVLANTFQPLITPPVEGDNPPTPPTPPTTPPETPETPNTPHTPDVYFGRFKLLKNSTADEAAKLAHAQFDAWSLPVWGFWTNSNDSTVTSAVSDINAKLRAMKGATPTPADYAAMNDDLEVLRANASSVFERTPAAGTNLAADYTTTDKGVVVDHPTESFDSVYPAASTSVTGDPANGNVGKLVAAKNAKGDNVSFHAVTGETDANGQAIFGSLPVDVSGTTLGDNDVYRIYALVETKAPDGYELLKSPTYVKVTYNESVNSDGTHYLSTVSDAPKTSLPFTGGQGLLILILTAAGLMIVGGTGIYYSRKRNRDNDDTTEA